jgi:hypothetical protein
MNLLRSAEGLGFPRRPHETADEFALALGEPREPLATTTGIFDRARYGPEELTDDDVALAEGGSDTVRAHLSRQPPPRRQVVRDADTATPKEE